MLLALIVVLSVGWSMRGRLRLASVTMRPTTEVTRAIRAVMEARKNHGRLW